MGSYSSLCGDFSVFCENIYEEFFFDVFLWEMLKWVF